MKIRYHGNVMRKMNMEAQEIEENGAITIVAFGDSVTHGVTYPNVVDYESVYWNRLRKMLNGIRNYVPVNIIDSGIDGTTAARSVQRLERDVLCHHPDLVIVMFGLNDVNFPIEEYKSSLRTIISSCLDAGSDVILMTPNMMNTYVADGTWEKYADYAVVTAEYQNSGKLDTYMDAAREIAAEQCIPIADCYAKWKEFAAEGKDTTLMLSNLINHPLPEMHQLFADELFRIITE